MATQQAQQITEVAKPLPMDSKKKKKKTPIQSYRANQIRKSLLISKSEIPKGLKQT